MNIQSPPSVTSFQVAVLVISILVVFLFAFELLFDLPTEAIEIFIYVDMFICVIFFIDFVQQFHKAPSKLEYMKLGWIDLISCIPLTDVNQYGRFIRMVRLLRVIKSVSIISRVVNENRAVSSIHFLIVTSLIMLVFGSLYVLYLEKDIPGANIHTAADAFWWTFITITTVGYGDYYPVTFEGRIVAIVLITTGVGLFSSLTAILASWILNPQEERRREEAVKKEVNELKDEIRQLKEMIARNAKE